MNVRRRTSNLIPVCYRDSGVDLGAIRNARLSELVVMVNFAILLTLLLGETAE